MLETDTIIPCKLQLNICLHDYDDCYWNEENFEFLLSHVIIVFFL